MKTLPATLLLVATLLCTAHAESKKKKKPSPPVKPQTSVMDMANAEARKFDENKDGKISGPEVSPLRAVWPANPKSWLYLFDENSNGRLDDLEIAAIRCDPPAKPSAPAPAKQPPSKKKKK